MPHHKFWKSINIIVVGKLFLFPSNRGSDITLLELTNQVALLKYLSYGMKIKNRFKKNYHWKRPIPELIIFYEIENISPLHPACWSNLSV